MRKKPDIMKLKWVISRQCSDRLCFLMNPDIVLYVCVYNFVAAENRIYKILFDMNSELNH